MELLHHRRPGVWDPGLRTNAVVRSGMQIARTRPSAKSSTPAGQLQVLATIKVHKDHMNTRVHPDITHRKVAEKLFVCKLSRIHRSAAMYVATI